MKRVRRLQIWLAILLVGALMFTAGCGLQTNGASPSGPPPFETAQKKSGVGMECVLYFDNTQSMSGFVRAQNSDFIRVTDAVYELMNSWAGGSSYCYIDKVREGQYCLDWTELHESDGVKFKEAYKHPNPSDAKCFFTYGKGYLPKGKGPLQLLFPNENFVEKTEDAETKDKTVTVNSIVDFNKVNIFITDMAEQNKSNTVLAQNLLEVMRTYDDHSVTMYAIKSNFTGRASVTNSGTVDESEGGSSLISGSFNNARLPFYIIIIGPTQDALKFSYDLRRYYLDMNSQIEYNYEAFLANGGLREADPKEIRVARTVGLAGSEYDALYKGDLNANNSNETVQLQTKSQVELYPEYKEQRSQTAYYFAVDQQKKNFSQAVVNLYIPLPGVLDEAGSGSKKDVKPVVYQDISAEAAYTCGFTDADEHENEQIAFKYSRTQQPSALSANAGTTTAAQQTTQVTEKSAENEWVQLSRDGIGQLIDVSSRVLHKGERVPRLKEASAGQENKVNIPGYAYEVESPSGALQMQLKLRSIEALRQRTGNGYISIRLPVTAVVQMQQELPDWVQKWTYYSAESTEPNDKFLKTEGLDSFFYVMYGTFGEAKNLPEWRKVILDLAIDIKLDA